MKIATPDLGTNSDFPALAAEELGLYRAEGLDAHSGLLPSPDAVNALREGAVAFVQKPYNLNELAQALATCREPAPPAA